MTSLRKLNHYDKNRPKKPNSFLSRFARFAHPNPFNKYSFFKYLIAKCKCFTVYENCKICRNSWPKKKVDHWSNLRLFISTWHEIRRFDVKHAMLSLKTREEETNKNVGKNPGKVSQSGRLDLLWYQISVQRFYWHSWNNVKPDSSLCTYFRTWCLEARKAGCYLYRSKFSSALSRIATGSGTLILK